MRGCSAMGSLSGFLDMVSFDYFFAMKVSLFTLRFWLVVARVGLVASKVLDLLCILEGFAFIWVCWAFANGYVDVVEVILRWGMWAVYVGAVCVLLRWLALWVCGRVREVLDAAGVENE